jgi:hypothetical protein
MSVYTFRGFAVGKSKASASSEIEQQHLGILDTLELQDFFLRDSGFYTALSRRISLMGCHRYVRKISPSFNFHQT